MGESFWVFTPTAQHQEPLSLLAGVAECGLGGLQGGRHHESLNAYVG
jgi:hypothetical protein